MEFIITTIQTLGFPIACVIACGIYIYKISENNRVDTKERELRMNTQLDKFALSMDRFNDTLTKIDTRLEAVEKKLDE